MDADEQSKPVSRVRVDRAALGLNGTGLFTIAFSVVVTVLIMSGNPGAAAWLVAGTVVVFLVAVLIARGLQTLRTSRNTPERRVDEQSSLEAVAAGPQSQREQVVTGPLADLKEQYTEIIETFARAVDMPNAHWLPQFLTEPSHIGSAHIEYESGTYSYVVTERGMETRRRRTNDPDELLYWLARGAASEAACTWEMWHRREGEDSRRQWFKLEIELLQLFSEEWAERKREEQREVLKTHPFRDEN
ncbi:MAG: Imm63 family immunity protein [Phycisphaerales bacterium]